MFIWRPSRCLKAPVRCPQKLLLTVGQKHICWKVIPQFVCFYIPQTVKCPNVKIGLIFCIVYCSGCWPIVFTANIVFVTYGTISTLWIPDLELIQSELLVLPLRTMSVYSEDCHCGQTEDSGWWTHMCDVAMPMLCVFPRDLFGLLNSKTTSSKQGIAW